MVHRSQTLSVLKNGALSPSVHRHVHGEVIEPLQRAGEDARVRAVGFSLVDQHIHELQDTRVVGGAVSCVQLGCEGDYSSCSGGNNADLLLEYIVFVVICELFSSHDEWLT